MRSRKLLMALLASLAISALFTFTLSRRLPRTRTVAAAVTRSYVVAARDLQAGERLQADALQLAPWNGAAPLEGSFRNAGELDSRIVLYPLAAGQPILERQLAESGAGVGLAYKIPSGMRAISVKTTEITGVSGFLLPGTQVDALLTTHSANAADARTSTLVQNVQVLAAGQRIEPDPGGKPVAVDVVTLLVRPADAERVALAMALGDVHFLLRNGADHVQQDVGTIDAEHLVLAGSPAATPRTVTRPQAPGASAAPGPYQVEMINGDKQHRETF